MASSLDKFAKDYGSDKNIIRMSHLLGQLNYPYYYTLVVMAIFLVVLLGCVSINGTASKESLRNCAK